MTDIKARLTRIYAEYNPACVASIDTILQTYSGREEELIATLVGKYGPEPTTADPSHLGPEQAADVTDHPNAPTEHTPTDYMSKPGLDRQPTLTPAGADEFGPRDPTLINDDARQYERHHGYGNEADHHRSATASRSHSAHHQPEVISYSEPQSRSGSQQHVAASLHQASAYDDQTRGVDQQPPQHQPSSAVTSHHHADREPRTEPTNGTASGPSAASASGPGSTVDAAAFAAALTPTTEEIRQEIRQLILEHEPHEAAQTEAVLAAYEGREADVLAVLKKRFGLTTSASVSVARTEDDAAEHEHHGHVQVSTHQESSSGVHGASNAHGYPTTGAVGLEGNNDRHEDRSRSRSWAHQHRESPQTSRAGSQQPSRTQSPAHDVPSRGPSPGAVPPQPQPRTSERYAHDHDQLNDRFDGPTGVETERYGDHHDGNRDRGHGSEHFAASRAVAELPPLPRPHTTSTSTSRDPSAGQQQQANHGRAPPPAAAAAAATVAVASIPGDHVPDHPSTQHGHVTQQHRDAAGSRAISGERVTHADRAKPKSSSAYPKSSTSEKTTPLVVVSSSPPRQDNSALEFAQRMQQGAASALLADSFSPTQSSRVDGRPHRGHGRPSSSGDPYSTPSYAETPSARSSGLVNTPRDGVATPGGRAAVWQRGGPSASSSRGASSTRGDPRRQNTNVTTTARDSTNARDTSKDRHTMKPHFKDDRSDRHHHDRRQHDDYTDRFDTEFDAPRSMVDQHTMRQTMDANRAASDARRLELEREKMKSDKYHKDLIRTYEKTVEELSGALEVKTEELAEMQKKTVAVEEKNDAVTRRAETAEENERRAIEEYKKSIQAVSELERVKMTLRERDLTIMELEQKLTSAIKKATAVEKTEREMKRTLAQREHAVRVMTVQHEQHRQSEETQEERHHVLISRQRENSHQIELLLKENQALRLQVLQLDPHGSGPDEFYQLVEQIKSEAKAEYDQKLEKDQEEMRHYFEYAGQQIKDKDAIIDELIPAVLEGTAAANTSDGHVEDHATRAEKGAEKEELLRTTVRNETAPFASYDERTGGPRHDERGDYDDSYGQPPLAPQSHVSQPQEAHRSEVRALEYPSYSDHASAAHSTTTPPRIAGSSAVGGESHYGGSGSVTKTSEAVASAVVAAAVGTAATSPSQSKRFSIPSAKKSAAPPTPPTAESPFVSSRHQAGGQNSERRPSATSSHVRGAVGNYLSSSSTVTTSTAAANNQNPHPRDDRSLQQSQLQPAQQEQLPQGLASTPAQEATPANRPLTAQFNSAERTMLRDAGIAVPSPTVAAPSSGLFPTPGHLHHHHHHHHHHHQQHQNRDGATSSASAAHHHRDAAGLSTPSALPPPYPHGQSTPAIDTGAPTAGRIGAEGGGVVSAEEDAAAELGRLRVQLSVQDRAHRAALHALRVRAAEAASSPPEVSLAR